MQRHLNNVVVAVDPWFIFQRIPIEVLLLITKEYLDLSSFFMLFFVSKAFHEIFTKIKPSHLGNKQSFDKVKVFSNAIRFGHLDIIKWLRSHWVFKDKPYGLYFEGEWSGYCTFAAVFGHLNTFIYLEKEGYTYHNDALLHKTAKNGHINLLNHFYFAMLRDDRIVKPYHYLIKWCRKVAIGAAMGGQINVLKWLREDVLSLYDRKNSIYLTSKTFANAAHQRQIEVLKYLHELKCPMDEFACSCAASSGDLDTLKYLRSIGCPWDESTCSSAAEYGHYEVLKWARVNGCQWNEDTFALAISDDSVTVDDLKWLKDERCPCDERACAQAAKYGLLDVLIWLRSHHCPWNESTCIKAAKHGHLDILEWSINHGCIYDCDTFKAAVLPGRYEIIHYLMSINCPCHNNVCKYPAKEGYITVLRCFQDTEYNDLLNHESVSYSASRSGQLDILIWLKENGYFIVDYALAAANENGHSHIVQWFNKS